MGGMRLDLDAPLISVRRVAAFSVQSQDAKGQSLGVENIGAVPFIWEKRPGYPIDNSGYVAGVLAGGSTAALNLPPGRILIHASQQMPDPARTQTPITRPPEEVEESDETGNYENTGYLYSKAEGLISSFRLKSSICLFNPVSGMKVRDLPPTKPSRMFSPRVKISNDERIVEEVYRNRLRNVDYIENDVCSKLSTEFNQLTYLIDSQTPESSSSFHHYSADALLPIKSGDVKNLRADVQEKSFNNSVAPSLLSLPLPKPPSDSWLKRTLPSISAKGPYQQSFLGTKFHPKNQTLRASRGVQKLTIPDNLFRMYTKQKHLLCF